MTVDYKRSLDLIELHYQELLRQQKKLEEQLYGGYGEPDTYVIMGEAEPKKGKGRKQDGGMARYKERKWPVADNGLPVLEPGLYWLVDKVNATIDVSPSSSYSTDMQTREVNRLCLMNAHKKEHYGFLMMQTRDKREASVRLLRGNTEIPLTPSNLLDQADWLMDKMEAKRVAAAEKAKQDELLGDYRHKALEIER